MNFIEAKNSRRYAASRILSIGQPETRHGEGITEVELEGVGPVEFYTWRIQEFLRAPVTAFPAEPETYILYPSNEVPGECWRARVIGWGSARDGVLYPMTADGVNDGVDSEPFILTPDGQVSQRDAQSWRSLELFLADQQRLPMAAE
jgi:hypothetical protein